ncbi:MAG: T9SS type A sorting domain-containing protein, partial [bacterium]|nr:T9SS type A sorting domain-containing protein [bacterium]
TENSPLLNNTIWDVKVDMANNVWLGTNYGLAVYRQRSTKVNLRKPVLKNQIDVDKLLSNYPNPFNNFTQIWFYVSETRHVNMTIFDISGNFILKLTDRIYSAGIHHVLWNGKDSHQTTAPSGNYFCRFETDNQFETRCITFLK